MSFDVLVEAHGGGGEYDTDAFGGVAPLVAIETPGGVLVYVTADLPDIDGDWKHYDMPLVNDAAWFLVTGFDPLVASNLTAVQFAAAIGSMTRNTIISEWLKDGGDVDTGAVDNFQLIPLPGALPLFGSAILLAGLARRKAA